MTTEEMVAFLEQELKALRYRLEQSKRFHGEDAVINTLWQNRIAVFEAILQRITSPSVQSAEERER
jgi:primosomal protein N''